MKKYIFEGASDDTFGEYKQTGIDHDNCANGEPIQFKIQTHEGYGVIVTGIYGGKYKMGNGCWMIGVESIDEGKPIEWDITMHPSHEGYRNRLVIIAPDESFCEYIDNEYTNPSTAGGPVLLQLRLLAQKKIYPLPVFRAMGWLHQRR